jgi:integrase
MEIDRHYLNGGTHEEMENGRDGDKHSLLSFLQGFIGEIHRGRSQIRKSTGKNYQSLHSKLELYLDWRGKVDLHFDDINQSFYKDFVEFLLKDGSCTLAGAGKHIKNLKSIMNKALERKLHTNTAHQSKSFKVFRIEPHKIFLTEEEIEKMAGLDLTDAPELEREKDRFLLAYYFLLRFSDVRRLKKSMFFENNGKKYLRIRHQKTDQEAIIPAKKEAIQLLEKHNYHLDFTANQVANRNLKLIAGLAGLTDITNQAGRSLPKAQFVTTHTARRSAATNLYLQGVSLKTIADIGGWRNIRSLMTYLKASGMDSARIASELDFFK